jgi:hypothetical protein
LTIRILTFVLASVLASVVAPGASEERLDSIRKSAYCFEQHRTAQSDDLPYITRHVREAKKTTGQMFRMTRTAELADFDTTGFIH